MQKEAKQGKGRWHMERKRFYDENGKEIRSRPTKQFYQKWWFWLMASILTIVVVIAFSGGKFITEKPVKSEPMKTGEEKEKVKEKNKEIEATETLKEAVEEPTYTYEDFMGTYVTFEGDPYDSPINYLVSLEDDFIIDGPMNSGSLLRNIVDKTITGNVLTLDWHENVDNNNGITSSDPSGTLQLELDDQGDQKRIRFITNDDWMDDLFYSMSDQTLLDQYDIHEIDYARIIMMTGIPRIDPIEPIVYVRKLSAGDPIFKVDGSASYPENVTSLSAANTSFSNHDIFSIAYSAHGDGHITIYPQSSNFEIDLEAQSDEDYRQLAQKVLDNAENVYVDPSTPYLVADFIGRVEFNYD